MLGIKPKKLRMLKNWKLGETGKISNHLEKFSLSMVY